MKNNLLHSSRQAYQRLACYGVLSLLNHMSHAEIASQPTVTSQPSTSITSYASQVANSTTNHPSNQPTNSVITLDTHSAMVTQTTRQQIQDIIHSQAFSKVTPTTKWVEKNPKPTSQASGHHANFWQRIKDFFSRKKSSETIDIGGVFGVIAKLILLAALLAFVIWIIKNRELWLGWFSKNQYSRQSAANRNITSYTAQDLLPLWQQLPPRQQIPETVRQYLMEQNWITALSILYRATLREIVTIHDVPITRATTEQQCAWLLDQAKTKHPVEAHYFRALVQVWSEIAYGQQLPTAEQMPAYKSQVEQLITQFIHLYLTTVSKNTSLKSNQTIPSHSVREQS